MTRYRLALAALTLPAAALALAAVRPAWALRALCAATGPHAYIWCEPVDGGPAHLACLTCRTMPRMLTRIEPARAGCHGCVDCVCKSPAWPAEQPIAG